MVLIAENAVALYFYFNAPAGMPPLAADVMAVLQILEAVGIAALSYVTWK